MQPLPALLATLALLSAVHAQAPAPPPFDVVHPQVDSGWRHHPGGAAPVVVFRHDLRLDGAHWLQLRLAEGSHLPAGSRLRLTALADGAVQRHDARSLATWSRETARFNGDALRLELLAAPGSRGNRVVLDRALRGLPPAAPESICGNFDDRRPSSDPRQGRLLIGCTGWMAGRDILCTAGHCRGSAPQIVEFNVPLSTSSGQTRAAHPDDQYPYQVVAAMSGGIGADWAVCRVGPNSNHGSLPTDRNGDRWYRLGDPTTTAINRPLRVTGYGVTSPRDRYSQTQQSDAGPLRNVTGDALGYATDTTGGNSGSPVIDDQGGGVLGIHTHGGCAFTGYNQGTRIDRTDLAQALRGALSRPGTFRGFGQGCPGSGATLDVCVALNGSGGSLTSRTAGVELAYQVDLGATHTVAGFRIYSRSTTSGEQVVPAALYAADARGLPSTPPLATATLTIGPTPDFHEALLAAPQTLTAGRYFLGVDHSAGTTVISNVSSLSSGRAFERTPGGTWSLSSLVNAPAWQVLCPGNGNGLIPRISGSGTPELGHTFRLSLSAAAPNVPVTVVTGRSASTWAGGALPFDLGGLGAPGCALLVSTEAPSAALRSTSAGDVRLDVPVPDALSLLGLRLYHQGIVLDSGANVLGIALSDALETSIGG